MAILGLLFFIHLMPNPHQRSTRGQEPVDTKTSAFSLSRQILSVYSALAGMKRCEFWANYNCPNRTVIRRLKNTGAVNYTEMYPLVCDDLWDVKHNFSDSYQECSKAWLL